MEINKKVFLFLLAIMAISSVAMERNDPAIGMYTKAFEYEVQNNECRKLKCQIVKSYGSYTSTQPVEVGYSEVPGIYGHPYKVKHFVDKPVTKTYSSGYRCTRCNCTKDEYYSRQFNPPKIKINQEGNTRVMTLHGNADFHIAYFHICDNPDLYGELKEIWDKAKLSGWVSLESLWKAARQLDDEMEQDHNKTNTEYDDEIEQDYNKTNIEYVVKVTSSFCTIL